MPMKMMYPIAFTIMSFLSVNKPSLDEGVGSIKFNI